MDCKGLKGEELKKCQEKNKKNLTNTLKKIQSNRETRQSNREEAAALRKAKRDSRRSKRIEYSQTKNPLGLKGLGTVTKIPRLR
jgi:hypothetical protein